MLKYIIIGAVALVILPIIIFFIVRSCKFKVEGTYKFSSGTTLSGDVMNDDDCDYDSKENGCYILKKGGTYSYTCPSGYRETGIWVRKGKKIYLSGDGYVRRLEKMNALIIEGNKLINCSKRHMLIYKKTR